MSKFKIFILWIVIVGILLILSANGLYFYQNNDSGGKLYLVEALVTHDAKVAAKCSRVLYIVDGNIKGEYISLKDLEIKENDRERLLNNWLLELGW